MLFIVTTHGNHIYPHMLTSLALVVLLLAPVLPLLSSPSCFSTSLKFLVLGFFLKSFLPLSSDAVILWAKLLYVKSFINQVYKSVSCTYTPCARYFLYVQRFVTCLPPSLSSDQSSCSCFSEIIIESPFTRWLVNVFLRHFYTDLCSHILVSLKVSQTAHSLYLIPLYCTNNSTILLLAYGMWCMYLIITVLKITISHLERWFTIIIIVATVCVCIQAGSKWIYIWKDAVL